ncbi:MAG: response regulator, partial [Zwartia sp.]
MTLSKLPPWKILIVDDEQGLHDVTHLVLRKMQYDGRPIELISAYSAKEAEEIIKVTPSIAVAIIDVVMEHDQAGLDLVKIIRNQYGMKQVRIILRTGNPGMAPEREVIQHLEIDDYRDKTELTA